MTLVVIVSCIDASTGQLFAQKKYRESFSKTYVEHAFENEKSTLQRLTFTDGFLTFWPNCNSAISAKCEKTEIRRKVNGALPRIKDIQFRIKTFKPNLYIKFTDQSEMNLDKRQFSQLYAGQFIDTSDEECALFYKVKQSTISEAAILVSLDATDLKQRTCLVVQFNRALGMKVPTGANFTKIWNDGTDPARSMSEQEFEKMKRFYDVLTTLHMCSELNEGMNFSEVASALADEKCWSTILIEQN